MTGIEETFTTLATSYRTVKFALAFSAAIFLGLAGIVPISSGPLSSPAQAHHWPQKCGSAGKRPCRLWEHVPSCRPGLIEDLGKDVCRKPEKGKVIGGDPLKLRANCGREGQAACKFPVVPSCDEGLVEQIGPGICTAPGNDIISMAANFMHDSGPLVEAIGKTVIDCGAASAIGSGFKARSPVELANERARRLLEQPCLRSAFRRANEAGYKTLTIGVAGGVSVGIGGEGENGIAFDTGMRNAPVTYHTLSLVFNSLGAGTSYVVGLYKAENRMLAGDAHGASVNAKFGGGVGAAAWFNYDGSVSGMTIALETGGGAEAAYVRNTTEIVDILSAIQPQQIAQVEAPPSYVEPGYAPVPPRLGPVRRPPPPPTTTQAAGDAISAMARGWAAANELRKRQSYVKFCNRSDHKTINLAVASAQPARMGRDEAWKGEGWWVIKRKKCVTLTFAEDQDGYGFDQTVMLYAEVSNGGPRWRGEDFRFCITDGARFEYFNPEQKSCDKPNERWVMARALDVSPGGQRYNFNE